MQIPKRTAAWLLTVAALVPLVSTVARAHGDLTVTSWGGAYTRSQMLAYVIPYEAETGLTVDVATYNGELADVRAQIAAYNVTWDVVDMELGDAIRGCEEGLLLPSERPKWHWKVMKVLPSCGLGLPLPEAPPSGQLGFFRQGNWKPCLPRLCKLHAGVLRN